MLDEEDYKKIDSIIDNSIVIEDVSKDEGFGEEIKEIAREFTDKNNRFLFGNTNNPILFDDACIGAIGDLNDKPINEDEIIFFLKRFRFHYHTGRCALKFGFLDRFKETVGSLLAFKGALAWREAGTIDMEEEKKRSIVDKIKGR